MLINRTEKQQEAYNLIKDMEEPRESFLGIHFIETYLECPWKFFLKYVLGFQKDINPRYFIRGQAIHTAIEYFLSGYDIHTITELPRVYIEHNRERYQSDEELETDLSLVDEGIREWVNNNKDDREKYEEIEHETPHTIYLSNGFPITVRLDRLVRSKETGRLYVIDTKTTKNNMTNILKNMKMGNQGIGYLYAVEQLYDEKPSGIIVDILLMKANKYSNKIETYRSPVLSFNRYAFIQWEMNMIGILSEIAQKVKTYYDGSLPEEVLFPRHPNKCSFMGCEYEDICRKKHRYDVIPEGYYRDSWADEDRVKNLFTDRSYLDKLLYEMVNIKSEDIKEDTDV